MFALGWIIPLAILVFYLGSPRFLGTVAPGRVGRLLNAMLDKSRYAVLHDLVLPAGGRTLHLDHVVISRNGIFVIDSLYLTGLISGTDVQERWKRTRGFRTVRLDNPVHGNRLKIQTLERLLALPASRFIGLVVVCGHRGLASGIPDNVLGVDRVVARIRAASRPLLSAEEADAALKKLHDLSLNTSAGRRGWKWKLLRASLFLILCGGILVSYHRELSHLVRAVQVRADQSMAPEKFHADGRPKTPREIWEDKLVCALSVDTGLCVCYQPGGEKAEVPHDQCRSLAERGSILKR